MSGWNDPLPPQTARRELICSLFWPSCCAGIIADYAEFADDYEKLPILFPGDSGTLRVGPVDILWGPFFLRLGTGSVYYTFRCEHYGDFVFRYLKRLYLTDAVQADIFNGLKTKEGRNIPYDIQREYCIALTEMLAAIE